MRRRTCPSCELRFKSRPRQIGNSEPVVTCPRCGHLLQGEGADMLVERPAGPVSEPTPMPRNLRPNA